MLRLEAAKKLLDSHWEAMRGFVPFFALFMFSRIYVFFVNEKPWLFTFWLCTGFYILFSSLIRIFTPIL